MENFRLGIQFFASVALAAAILLAYSIINGVPFLYPDTTVYIPYGQSALEFAVRLLEGDFGALVSNDQAARLATDGPVGSAGYPEQDVYRTASRSVYYGVLASLSFPLGLLWTPAAAQAVSVAFVIALSVRIVNGGLDPIRYLTLIAALSLLTPLGVFSATVMPDVWAGIMILSLGLILVCPDRLSWFEIAVLSGFILFAAITHSSHLAVLGGFAVLALVLGGTRLIATSSRFQAAALPGALFVTAMGLMILSHAAIERSSGAAPIRLPHLTAHLTEGGPGMALIEERCPEIGFEICKHKADLPMEWRAFLFRGPFMKSTIAERRILSNEDLPFALAVFAHDPVGVAKLFVVDMGRQLGRFGLETTPIRATIGESGAISGLEPEELRLRIFDGTFYEVEWPYQLMTAVTYAITIAAVLAIVAGLLGVGPAAGLAHEPTLRALVLVTLIGVAGNAAVCGGLASPYDRFQARIIWLIPAMAGLAIMRTRRPATHHQIEEVR